MTAGDFDAAMAQRCTAARVGPDDKSLFLDQASRLNRALGPITLSGVRRSEPPTGLQPFARLPMRSEMRYRLSVRGAEVGTDLLTVVVTEGGRPRLCAFATAGGKEFHASLPKTVGDAGPTARSLPDLIPATPAPGYRQIEDGPGTPREAEAVANWHRSWQEGDYGGATVSAIRYSSVAAADAAARRLLDGFASDAVEQFDAGGIDGAVGVRYLGYAWLWIQPPTEGPFIDAVVIRFNDIVVFASISNLAATDGHEVVNGLAGEIRRLAAL